MWRKICGIAALVVLAAVAARAESVADPKDLQLFKAVSDRVTTYSYFTIFDDVSASVKDGVVVLTGSVTSAFKRDEIEKRVRAIDGVRVVQDRIHVLPLSPMDDQVRYRVARAIYSDPTFTNYATVPTRPIHIVVENGHVTLTGVVANEFDRRIAEMRARQFPAFSVKNQLKTDEEMKAALERL
jgi:osmotically-inducible protein OsmY